MPIIGNYFALNRELVSDNRETIERHIKMSQPAEILIDGRLRQLCGEIRSLPLSRAMCAADRSVPRADRGVVAQSGGFRCTQPGLPARTARDLSRNLCRLGGSARRARAARLMSCQRAADAPCTIAE